MADVLPVRSGRSWNINFYKLPPPAIESDPFLLLIEEVIDYSLRHHNIRNWIPPVNLKLLRLATPTNYFNKTFGRKVIDHEVEESVIDWARQHGFCKENWLKLVEHEAAMNFQYFYLWDIYHTEQPNLRKVFSFACYLSRIAMQNNRASLVKDVVWALVYMFRQIISYKQYCEACNACDELSYVESDSLVLLFEELIDYSLTSSQLGEWVPPKNKQFLDLRVHKYFSESLGRAVTHPFTEGDAVFSAFELGFVENDWLELSEPSEAMNYMCYYLNHIFCSPFSDVFQVLSFACYASKVAMQSERESFVNAVMWALVYLFSCWFPYRQFYERLEIAAARYVHFFHGEEDDVDE